MGAFKLGKMTFGSLFKKPETVKYPLEKKAQPQGLKGHVVIDQDRCILCGMCERSCTTNCITVNRKERIWEIQPYQCVQCGYCITVCPKDCLSMDPNYAPAAIEMSVTRCEIPEQAKETVKSQPTVEKKPAPSTEKSHDAKAAPVGLPANRDPQVDALLGLMDPEKAEKVKTALS